MENYGLGGMPFTVMIEARWRQLMGLDDKWGWELLHTRLVGLQRTALIGSV